MSCQAALTRVKTVLNTTSKTTMKYLSQEEAQNLRRKGTIH